MVTIHGVLISILHQGELEKIFAMNVALRNLPAVNDEYHIILTNVTTTGKSVTFKSEFQVYNIPVTLIQYILPCRIFQFCRPSI